MTRIFDLDHHHTAPSEELAQLLGVKGAGLATMTSVLGLAVPPGFTIATTAVAELATGIWPPELEAELHRHVAGLERATGKVFGDPTDPLLVSVRSGAVVSMPGMLDTVLDVGLDDLAVEGLAARTGDERFAYDCFRRFLASYGTHVMGVDPSVFEDAVRLAGPAPLSATTLKELCHHHQESIARITGSPVPREAHHQLRTAIDAVASSWHGARAHSYRAHAGVLHEGATAVTVQAMVHGNRDARSCAGVASSRNPLTGDAEPFGEILFEAEGDDVMSGARSPLGLPAMRERLPEAYAQLTDALDRLEAHHRDMCEVELTVEQGALWLLQSRVAERSPAAAVRIAVALATDGTITRAEAASRVSSNDLARLKGVVTVGSADPLLPVLARGLPASAGVATGYVCSTVDRCMERAGRGDPVILVRPTTSPADVMGMRVAAGILTTVGGPASHAAVVARAWGIPAVVGASEVSFDGADDDAGGITIDGSSVGPDDLITIDGNTGDVLLGTPPSQPVPPPPELETLLTWRAQL